MADTIFNFFGLRENPFKINPDPRFLYATEQARDASAELAYAIRTRKGLILLTGEVGTGKTLLLRRLLDWLSEQNMPTALIFNSHIKPDHLLNFILTDFGVPCASTLKSEKLLALNRWLLERYRAGQIPVLIVDEAQGLDPAALEEIRLLLNFETPREKLLQIVLAGQPELEVKLKRHELRQLRQRITIRCRTFPLSLEQTYGYVLERLRVAGANGNPIFEPDALGSVHAYSHGIPRVINVLCEHSLTNACADGSTTVSSSAVDRAARDCQLDRPDSVVRVLKTGSYSVTSLSEISSMLAAIAESAEPTQRPQPHISEATPPPAQRSPRNLEPTAVAEQVKSGPTENSPLPPEQHQVANELSSTVAARSYTPEPAPRPDALQAKSHATSDVISAQPVAEIPVPQIRVPRTRPSPLAFLGHWGRSFISDLRSTSRQVRRAAKSFAHHRWNPFVRTLHRQLRQLRVHTSAIASDPRWKDLRSQAVSIAREFWNSFKSAMPPRLIQFLGIRQTETVQPASKTGSARTKRPRGIIALRRWLHQPLNTSQRKRTQGSQRRSST